VGRRQGGPMALHLVPGTLAGVRATNAKSMCQEAKLSSPPIPSTSTSTHLAQPLQGPSWFNFTQNKTPLSECTGCSGLGQSHHNTPFG
jgi:hypothetical protein